jgi:hypothetical protein
MPGQRGTEKRLMAAQVLVRLPSGTANAVAARADADGLTASAWIRARLVDLVGTEPADAIPVPARRAPRPPAPAHVLEVARLRESVAEMTGALVQAAIRSREGGRMDTHAAIEDTLPAVRRAVRDLDALKLAMLAQDPNP